MEETYLRAEAANENNFVNLPIFAAALVSIIGGPSVGSVREDRRSRQVAGNVARLTPNTLNTAAAIYLLSRVAFTLIYINGNGKNGMSCLSPNAGQQGSGS